MATLLKIIKPLVERFPSVAMAYRKWRDSRALSKEPELTKQGFKFN
jgi:hypothetical protein